MKRKLGVTSEFGIRVRGCSTDVAVGKDEALTLPRVSATDMNIIVIPIRNLPAFRHVHRLMAILNKSAIAIFNPSAIINFVAMQGHVQVGAVALRGRWQGGGGR